MADADPRLAVLEQIKKSDLAAQVVALQDKLQAALALPAADHTRPRDVSHITACFSDKAKLFRPGHIAAFRDVVARLVGGGSPNSVVCDVRLIIHHGIPSDERDIVLQYMQQDASVLDGLASEERAVDTLFAMLEACFADPFAAINAAHAYRSWQDTAKPTKVVTACARESRLWADLQPARADPTVAVARLDACLPDDAKLTDGQRAALGNRVADWLRDPAAAAVAHVRKAALLRNLQPKVVERVFATHAEVVTSGTFAELVATCRAVEAAQASAKRM
jgi:hypothetical protein